MMMMMDQQNECVVVLKTKMINTALVLNNGIYHSMQKVLEQLMFLKMKSITSNCIESFLPSSSSSLISSLSLKIGGRPGGGPGAFFVITILCNCSIELQDRKTIQRKSSLKEQLLFLFENTSGCISITHC